METDNFVDRHLPPSVIQKLEAGAFQSLCSHLRDRSDEVQNIDLMTVSGFCRNCLAKWLVVEARNLSDSLKTESGTSGVDEKDLDLILQSLDAMGYDEAAQYVYGMKYDEWKKRHSKKASEEIMQKFNDSKPLWAKHDQNLLEKRSDAPPIEMQTGAVVKPSEGAKQASLLSNVCCEDVDAKRPEPIKKKNRTREIPPYQPPALPKFSFSLGILTVSDRASSGEYETGDLSGPAVKEAVESLIDSNDGETKIQSIVSGIVPDELEAIQDTLKEWADVQNVQLILTTGGTGFSPRDVTPEATHLVVDQVCDGLVTFCTLECTRTQPLASLSRGSAGIRGKTLIVNLPGNPTGVKEIIPILLPLALHAVADLC